MVIISLASCSEMKVSSLMTLGDRGSKQAKVIMSQERGGGGGKGEREREREREESSIATVYV